MLKKNSTVPVSRVTPLTPFQLLVPPVKITVLLVALINVVSKKISLVKVVVPDVMLIPAVTVFPLIVRELPETSDPIVIEVVIVENGELVNVGVIPDSIRIGPAEEFALTVSIPAERVPELSSPAELETEVDPKRSLLQKVRQASEVSLKKSEVFLESFTEGSLMFLYIKFNIYI